MAKPDHMRVLLNDDKYARLKVLQALCENVLNTGKMLSRFTCYERVAPSITERADLSTQSWLQLGSPDFDLIV